MKLKFKMDTEGNWALNSNNYAIGSNVDHVEHMVKDNSWTASEAINNMLEMVNVALDDAGAFNISSLFDLLTSQSFSEWYEGDFMDFVEGEEACKTKEQIVEDLINFLRR